MFFSLCWLPVCGGFDGDCWCSTVDGRCGACGLAPPRALLVRELRESLFAMWPACSRDESGGGTVAVSGDMELLERLVSRPRMGGGRREREFPAGDDGAEE